MFPPGMNFSDAFALVGQVAPASVAAGTVSTAAINAAQHNTLGIVLNVPVVGAGDSIQLQIQASATSGGSYATVAGLNLPPALTAAGLQVYNLRPDFLANSGVGPYLKVQAVLTGANNSTIGIEVWGGMERYSPASDYNIAAVTSVASN